jgi:murein DD-endopeptidase MepM/ murein hydrolase activator NlpD
MGYIWPVDPSVYEVTQEFGANPNATLPDGTVVNPPGGHTGRDFATPIGTPVLAVGDGVIDFAGQADWTPNDNPLWMMGSICIILNCGDSEPDFTYGHLSSVSVAQGERVSQGQVIGYSGNTGASTGPHLHFEALPPGYVLDQWTYGRVDPRNYCSGVWSGVALAASGITPIAPQEEDIMATIDDLKNVLMDEGIQEAIAAKVWQGKGSWVQNRRLGHPEYAETILGSLEDRIQKEILAPQVAALSAKIDALTAVAAKGANVDPEALKQTVEDAVKASFGSYTVSISKDPAAPAAPAS